MRVIYILFYIMSTMNLASTHFDSTQSVITEACPELCKCNKEKKTVVCSNHGGKLSSIPVVPSYVKKLTLNNNYFKTLKRSSLHTLSSTQLSEIIMRASKIVNIENDTFYDLKYLRSLDLVANRHMNFTSLKSSFLSLRRSDLSLINLSKTGLSSKDISIHVFINIKGKIVDEVRLGGNNINTLPIGSLRGLENVRKFVISYNILERCETALLELKNLEFLTMENNQIDKCNISNLPMKLKNLQMDRNSLKRFPNFCSSNKTILPELKSLDLNQNEIRNIQTHSFQCLKALNYLNLSGNKIKRFPSYVFKALQNLQFLLLDDLKDRVISVNGGAFSIPSLTKFHFRGNKYNFRPLSKAKKASFRGNKNLTVLDLSFNKIPDSEIKLKIFLGGLPNLKIIRMRNVAWIKLPKSFFQMFPNLEQVTLSNNGIKRLTEGAFSGASRLKLLRLDANGITFVGPHTFPEYFWRSIETIDLSGNPFACTCDLLWFRDSLRNNRLSFHEYPKKYVCKSPDNQRGIQLSQFDLKANDCEEKSVLKIAIVSFISVLLSIFVAILAVYRFRWQIRYFIYICRYKDQKRVNINEAEFTYDAFVIYPEEDGDFVHDLMLQKLENENNMNICIHPRDFQPGKAIIENIVECLAKSRRALVVISRNFNNSKWCNFELLIAQDRWLNNEAMVPLIIMLGEVNYAWMKREIRSLVKTTTYARWTEDVNGQELFWRQIVSTIKDG